ncbi:MAG: YjjG family noncanonical pyrimidine nucleotidase [Clostridia bacterium]|nr:YjjG family noncanonical pyrimidine nucleotidase [Clostridia bacterium]
MKKYTTLLLDADNTLLDFYAAEAAAIEKTCLRFGIPFSAEVASLYSAINDSMWKMLEKGEITRDLLKVRRFEKFIKQMGATADPKEVAAFYEDSLAQGAILLPGADALCKRLSQHYELYIVTNGLKNVQRRRFAACGLAPYFKDVFISEEFGSQKPEKAFFDGVFAKLAEKDKTKVCIIGDSMSSDILGGINAGIDTCWFCKDGGAETYTPTYKAADFDELLRLFIQ